MVDEYSRECLAIVPGRRLHSEDVIEALADLFVERGAPAHIRSDNVLTSESSLPRRETLPWGRPLTGSFWISGQLWPCGLPLAM